MSNHKIIFFVEIKAIYIWIPILSKAMKIFNTGESQNHHAYSSSLTKSRDVIRENECIGENLKTRLVNAEAESLCYKISLIGSVLLVNHETV